VGISSNGRGEAVFLYWPTQSIKNCGEKAGLKGVGWHTFRHTYRTWLDETGAPRGVQQKLMRHADVRTTMNVYGDAILDTMRKVHSKVVKMALP
jgi:integrase